jgi:dsRNA-specific ribonuclease
LLQYLKRVLTSKAGQNQDVLKQLSFILGYKPRNPQVYFLALKHNSYTKSNGGKDFDSNEMQF